MIDIMPKKFISQDELKDWNNYSINLNSKPFVKKYLEKIMQKWAKNLSNPLAIFWVQKLFEDKLEELDKNLKALEKKLGKENLKLIFSELESKNGNEEEIIKTIKSLAGEIIAFNKFADKGQKNLKKINQLGDWENDSLFISVKSILDLDLNYQLVESTIWGMFFVEENDILRKYNKIKLSGDKNLDDKFRTKIIQFLKNSFLNILKFIDGELENTDEIKIKTTKFFTKNNQQVGFLEVLVNGYTSDKNKIIEIILQEDRIGEKKFNHQLKIKLELCHDRNDKIFSVDFETNTYWEDEIINYDYLYKSIQKYLDKIDKNKQNLKNKKDFVGWINISIHPMHECYVLGNKKKIGEFLRTMKCNRQYKVVFCLNPEIAFDLTKAIIIDI